MEAVWRRASVVGLCVVTAVCLFTLVLSQRMVAYTLHSTSFPAFGRTIQSWSSSETDGPSNVTAAIEMSIEEQRFHISEEMADYEYPNGKYNVSAKSLPDLVPELGGTPLRSIIISTWRSGSTFLGDVLNAHPANYYHYEPLLDYDIVQIRGAPLAHTALQTLRELLNCTYANLEHYLEYGQDHNWLFTHNTRLWERCIMHPQICWMPEFLTPFCRLFPFQSMKVVRLRLSLAEELLADPNLNLRVILLVRDPRGIMQSRRHRDWCPGRPDCWDPGRLCSDLLADYSAAIRLARLYPTRFRAVRYEDISLQPYTEVEDLFAFLGLSFHARVKQFLDTHTKTDAGGVSSTFRNSKAAPFHWRKDLSHKEVRAIQKACRPAMKAWCYAHALNATHQKDFNPIAKSFKLV